MFCLHVKLPCGYSNEYFCKNIDNIEGVFSSIILTLVIINGEDPKIIYDDLLFYNIFQISSKNNELIDNIKTNIRKNVIIGYEELTKK